MNNYVLTPEPNKLKKCKNNKCSNSSDNTNPEYFENKQLNLKIEEKKIKNPKMAKKIEALYAGINFDELEEVDMFKG